MLDSEEECGPWISYEESTVYANLTPEILEQPPAHVMV